MDGGQVEAHDGPLLSCQISRQALALCPKSIIETADAWAIGLCPLDPVVGEPQLLPLLFFAVEEPAGRAGGNHLSAGATVEEARVPEAAWCESGDGVRHPSDSAHTKKAADGHHAAKVVLIGGNDREQ